MTNLLLVSDPAIRCGLRMRLELEPDLTIVGEAGDGLTALSLASTHQPDVVVVEMETIGIDSPRFIKTIRTASPRTAVIVLSLRDDPLTRRRMEAAGAAAFVSKHENGNRLLQAIREAAAGYHDPSSSVKGFEKVRKH